LCYGRYGVQGPGAPGGKPNKHTTNSSSVSMGRYFTILLIFIHSIAPAQHTNTEKLDRLFLMLDSSHMALGSLAIAKNGNTVYQRSVGFRSLDAGRQLIADKHTKYRIGSVSKMFTAIMIFQLIEEGKIQLKQKLSDFFPDLPNAGKITIGHLLQHRSGLHDYTHDSDFQDWMTKPKTHLELLTIIKQKSPDFEPGVKADYSNTNYLLLSYIIEKLCKTPYKTALATRITARIKLTNTYYGDQVDLSKNESYSYRFVNNSWQKEQLTDLSIHSGAGSLVSTPTDLVTFITALYNYKLIKQSSLLKMQTMIDGYGMGMFPADFDTVSGYGHNGRIEEFYTSLKYFPSEKLAVCYITNGILYPRSDIVSGILKICFDNPYVLPFSSTATNNSNIDSIYLGKFASIDPPIEVILSKTDAQLFAETKGARFPLQPVAPNYFMYGAGGYFFEFFPEKNELQIKETDNIYLLKKTP
jgi:D-alanyl-D-alanine carboxypeptidase